MWKRVICIDDNMPQTMSEVDTRYCWSSTDKFAPPGPLRMIGGVMMPASIDKACWNPRSSARKTGIRSLRPKNGAARRVFLMNGMFGLNKNA